MLVRGAIVAERQARRATPFAGHRPGHGILRSRSQRAADRDHVDRCVLGRALEAVELVGDAEASLDTARDRVVAVDDADLELAVVLVAARAAADELAVVRGPLGPVDPAGRMDGE